MAKNATVVITEATLDDVEAISEVQKETWLATYPNEQARITRDDILSEDFFSKERLESRRKTISDPKSNSKFWVAKHEGKVIGYCCIQKLPDYNKIRSIYILPAFQGQGIGDRLMQKMFEFIDPTKPTKLSVAIYNTKAISFYEKHGFVKGIRHQKNPEGHFVSGREIPEMEMVKNGVGQNSL